MSPRGLLIVLFMVAAPWACTAASVANDFSSMTVEEVAHVARRSDETTTTPDADVIALGLGLPFFLLLVIGAPCILICICICCCCGCCSSKQTTTIVQVAGQDKPLLSDGRRAQAAPPGY